MKNRFTFTQLLILAVIALALFGTYLVGRSVDFEEVFQPSRLVEMLRQFGPWAPLILILSMATAVVISPIPSLPLDLAAGAVFGPLWGTFYVVIGAETGAILSFLIGRALGRDVISRLLGVDVVFCEKCSNHHLGVLIFVARLLPVFSFDVISYGAGLTTMSLRTFAWTTLLGMIPSTFALTYLGSSVVSAQWPLIVSGCVMVTFFMLMPKLVKQYRSSWLAQIMFGPTPAALPTSPVQAVPAPLTNDSDSCPGCGEPTASRRLPASPLQALDSAGAMRVTRAPTAFAELQVQRVWARWGEYRDGG
jgi:uncharacterized membrane protein YdjX (TVP38/TMEM64 family)